MHRIKHVSETLQASKTGKAAVGKIEIIQMAITYILVHTYLHKPTDCID